MKRVRDGETEMAKTFTVKHRVEFRDTDAARIMHFSAFFTYMEETEHAFLRSIGLSVMNCEVEGVHISWPRVSVHCDYQKPLKFEQEFEVATRIKKLGGKSVTYGFVFSNQDAESVAQGEMTVVCCSMGEEGIRAVEIPAIIREKLGVYEDARE